MALNFFVKSKSCCKFLYQLTYNKRFIQCTPVKLSINIQESMQQLKKDPSELGKIVDFEESKVIEKPKSDVKYSKISGTSSILTSFLVNVKSRKKREKSKTILLEGKRLIQDALDAKMKPLAVFFSRVSDVTPFKLDTDIPLYHVPYKDLQLWSEVTTSQGVLAIFPMPDTEAYSGIDKMGLTIVCDNVRDPGNMGTILRTAAAVGSSQIILTTGCADLWEPKILRSSSGAHFRLKIYSSVSWADLPGVLPKKYSLYLADSDIPEVVDEESLVDRYELSKTGEKVPIIENQAKRITAYQKSHTEKKTPLLMYTEPNYSVSSDIVLVVGGETEGLSKDMLEMAETMKGTRVYIPLENGIESLNSATALSILAYEIRKQRLGL